MDEPLQNASATAPQPSTPSFGLPPETPTMPGTSDHHIEPVPIPPSSIDIEPLAPVRSTPPPPISNVILPQHNTAPAPNTTALPPFPNTTQVPPPPVMPPPTQPLRTSMNEARVRDVENASPKDYGILPEKRPIIGPPPPLRPSAQDMLYESALGKPLEGPVIPSTRPRLSETPPQTPVSPPPLSQQTPAPSVRLNPATLATPPTPHEAAQDALRQGVPPSVPTDAAAELAHHTAIRTLESDVATTVAKNRLSVSGIALAQQRERLSETLDEHVAEKRFSWWALSGIILAVLGVGVITVAYLMQVNAPESEMPEITTTQDALIPAVPETTLDITGMKRSDILRALSALTTQYASRGGISLVRFIAYRDEIIEDETVRLANDVTAEQFLTQLSSRAGSRLSRALGTQSFFGVVTVSGRAIPFLAFETTSYDSAFAGMLEWETLITEDLPFLTYTPPVREPAPTPATTTATSTQSGTSTPIAQKPAVITITPTTPTFLDIVVKNRDARAVKNSDGSTKLLYAFPTPVILLITQHEDALGAIIDHLSTARFSK